MKLFKGLDLNKVEFTLSIDLSNKQAALVAIAMRDRVFPCLDMEDSIMCKEYGDDNDWVGVTAEDMEENGLFSSEYKTFNISYKNPEIIDVTRILSALHVLFGDEKLSMILEGVDDNGVKISLEMNN